MPEITILEHKKWITVDTPYGHRLLVCECSAYQIMVQETEEEEKNEVPD